MLDIGGDYHILGIYIRFIFPTLISLLQDGG
jgi:hypothetical protein